MLVIYVIYAACSSSRAYYCVVRVLVFVYVSVWRVARLAAALDKRVLPARAHAGTFDLLSHTTTVAHMHALWRVLFIHAALIHECVCIASSMRVSAGWKESALDQWPRTHARTQHSSIGMRLRCGSGENQEGTLECAHRRHLCVQGTNTLGGLKRCTDAVVATAAVVIVSCSELLSQVHSDACPCVDAM